jgi:hypothetical protein
MYSWQDILTSRHVYLFWQGYSRWCGNRKDHLSSDHPKTVTVVRYQGAIAATVIIQIDPQKPRYDSTSGIDVEVMPWVTPDVDQ